VKADSPSASDVAALLIAHEMRDGPAVDNVRPVASALQRAVVELSRWIGTDGCRALLTRALSRAGQHHRALANVKVVSNSVPVLQGVEDSVLANGESAVGAGLTTTLVQLFEVLGRLIGADLTLKLAERITAADSSAAAQGEDEEERPYV
jgi:hypothetical protein